MNKILDFWKRNSTFILVIMTFLFFMDFCGRMIMPTANKKQENKENSESVFFEETKSYKSSGLKSYEQIMMERKLNKSANWTLLSWLAALAAVGAAGYFAHKKGWLKQLIPDNVRFKTTLLQDKFTQRLLMRLYISNTTNESQTFLLPHVLFKKSFEVKRFRLKSDDFPLTLTPGTSHTMVIDLQQFWEKVPSLANFHRIGAEIDTTSGRVFKTFAMPKWWVFKRI